MWCFVFIVLLIFCGRGRSRTYVTQIYCLFEFCVFCCKHFLVKMCCSTISTLPLCASLCTRHLSLSYLNFARSRSQRLTSNRRISKSQPRPWQGRALPLSYCCMEQPQITNFLLLGLGVNLWLHVKWSRRRESNPHLQLGRLE